MDLSKEEIEIILEVFDEYGDMLSELSRGTMMLEEWEVYFKLKSEL